MTRLNLILILWKRSLHSKLYVNDDSIRESDLREFFRHNEGEKTQEYFVYFKFLRQNCGGKRPQGAEAALDQSFP